MDQLFDLAARHSLRVILKPQLECAPDWAFDELGGMRIGFHGRPIDPIAIGACYVGGWWPCFDNPAVVSAASAFVTKLVKRYRKHPALWFYDAWNEPMSRPLGSCHCAHSRASYSAWLKRRFGTIEKLNHAYGKAWTSFASVRPPEAAEDYAEMFLWRQWAGFAVSEQVRFASEAIRAADPKAFVMVHAGLSLIKQDTAWFTSDDIQNAAHVDRYGTSFWIPLHPKTPSDHAEPENQSAWLRRVDPLYWCHEFYPNHGHWGQPPEPRNLKRLVWSAIAGGPSGFTYWQWRSERFGNETNGWGLRNPDGSSTARSDVADGIAAVLKKHGHRLAGTRRPRSRVAMLFSHESDLLSRIETLPICFADLNDVDFSVEYSYKRAIRAAYSLYTHLGEPPDWVTPGDDLSGVKLLHITAAEVISAKAAKWLTAYVQGGGTLVAEMPFACRDDNTWLATSRPNHGLDALLGCKEGERIVVQPGDLAKFRNGPSVKAGGWRVELVPGKGKVLATWPNGTAAAVHHRVGQGQVFTLGVSLALSNSDRWREPSVTQTSRLLSAAGLRPWPWTTDQVNVFRRCGPDREVWIVLNVGDRERVVKLPASAVEVWEAGGTLNARNELRIPGGGTWVAELPTLTTR